MSLAATLLITVAYGAEATVLEIVGITERTLSSYNAGKLKKSIPKISDSKFLRSYVPHRFGIQSWTNISSSIQLPLVIFM
jgi:hypothetical protein